jgi:glycosyltransferase involved in cell wall biosynthesis
MDASPRLSLVIPAYNEAAVIARAVAEAERDLAWGFTEFEILIVDDGSADETAAVVAGCLPYAPHTRLLRHDGNKGYGAALRTGFEAARFPLVAFTDADCQFHLAELKDLAGKAGEFDIVVGYRRDRKDVFRRRFYSKGYNLLTRTLLGTGLRDVDCALKVFRRSVLPSLMPESRGFFVNSEMITRARQHEFTICELPVSHRPRAGGESKVSIAEIPKTFSKLVRFWWTQVVWGKPVVVPSSAPAVEPVAYRKAA